MLVTKLVEEMKYRALIVLNMFIMAKLYNLEGLVRQVITRISAPFHFKFENLWITENMREEIVRDGWSSDNETTIFQKLKLVVTV